MKHPAIVTAAALAFAATLSAAPAQAQNARSFASGHGSDAAACTLAAPCRTLAAAFAVTNAGGEIDVLDPAGYGSLTINKAISIVNDGVGTSSVLVPSGGIGITITAGSSDAVSLRGLTIEGAGVGTTGIQFNTGKSLTIENSVIRHVAGNGIDFLPSGTSKLAVSNTLVADNDGGGIVIFPSGAAPVAAIFNRVEANGNGNDAISASGTNSSGTFNITVFDSVAADNGGAGFAAGTSSASITLTLSHSVAANNLTGFVAVGTGATLRVARTTVTGNFNGWFLQSGGVAQSYGDNYIDGNGSNVGSLTPVTKQ